MCSAAGFQQLADDAPAGSAKSGADRHLALSAERTAQHHVGHIRTRDEQNKSHSSKHEKKCDSYPAPIKTLLKSENADAEVFVDRELTNEPCGNPVEFDVRLAQRDAGFEDGVASKHPVIALCKIGRRNQGHPKVDVIGKAKSFGHNANNRRGLPVHANLVPFDAGKSRIPLLPDVVAEHEYCFGSSMIVRRQECAPQQRLRIHHRKNAGGCALETVLVGRISAFAQDTGLIRCRLEGLNDVAWAR